MTLRLRPHRHGAESGEARSGVVQGGYPARQNHYRITRNLGRASETLQQLWTTTSCYYPTARALD